MTLNLRTLERPNKGLAMGSKHPPISSWPEWFGRAAQVFDDPRMKIAYYKDGQTGEPYSQESVHRTHQDIFDKLTPHSNHAILDIGCGVGYFTKFFSDKIKMIVGTDVSSHMIQSAYAMNPNGLFLVAKADAIPLKGKFFDRIFSYGVTQYLPDEATIERMLDEMSRLLKNDGKMLIGDILEPVHAASTTSYNKITTKGHRWWPEDLDHNLTKLYLSKSFFLNYAQRHRLTCHFFKQNILGRSIPTPRYDVIMTPQI
jgi:ubiquinone/menaquinone biosynthesis C-methylase UbiE